MQDGRQKDEVGGHLGREQPLLRTSPQRPRPARRKLAQPRRSRRPYQCSDATATAAANCTGRRTSGKIARSAARTPLRRRRKSSAAGRTSKRSNTTSAPPRTSRPRSRRTILFAATERRLNGVRRSYSRRQLSWPVRSGQYRSRGQDVQPAPCGRNSAGRRGLPAKNGAGRASINQVATVRTSARWMRRLMTDCSTLPVIRHMAMSEEYVIRPPALEWARVDAVGRASAANSLVSVKDGDRLIADV